MFKKSQTRQTKNKARGHLRIAIFAIILFFGIFFGIQVNQAHAVQVTSKLQSRYTQVKENPGLDKLPGGNAMSNLYQVALDTAKENDIVPLQEAFTQTRTNLNKELSCNLLDSDITNIVLSTDKSLLKQTESLLAGTNNSDESDTIKIAYKDFINSCNKLMQCKTEKDSTSPHLVCQDTVYKQFLITQQNIVESYTMKEGIYGTNFYQNANPDDSLFDLLIDVEAVGNILFKGFKSSETAQVLFYRMPERDKDGGGGGNVVEPGDPDFPDFPDSDNDINRYNIGGEGYPDAGFNCPENIEAATNSFDPPNTGNLTQTELDKLLGTNSLGETTLLEKLKKNSNSISTNNKSDNNYQEDAHYINGVGTIGNFCNYTEEAEIPIITGEAITGNIIPIQTGYCGDGIINDNEQCDDGNNDNTDDCLNTCQTAICGDGFLKTYHEQCDDGNLESGDTCSAICQIEESPYCGDGIIQTENGEQCDDANNDNNDSCLNTCQAAFCGDGYIWNTNEQCDDGNTTSLDCCDSQCQNEGFISAEEMALGDMLASLDALSETQGPEITEGCFQNCADLPISDRVLCMVDCTCGEISSPELRDAIDAGAFRIKYCMIPAESVEVISKGKTVFSIEEIFVAIKSLLLGLRDSGEMLKSVESKELMESTMMKNDFGEMFAFNINFNFKSLNGGAKDDGVKKEKAIQQNQNLMVGISNLGNTENFPKQRNKYIMIADIPASQARLKKTKDPDELQKEIEAARINFDKKIVLGGALDGDAKEEFIESHLSNTKTAIIAEEFMAFLNMNHSFRKNMNQMFEDIYSSTTLLRTKIEQ